MRKAKEVLLIGFEAVTVGGALLLVPCVLADLVFGCALTEPLAQVVLAAAVSTALLTALALHEGWYADHLTRMTGPGEHPPDLQGTLRPDRPRDER